MIESAFCNKALLRQYIDIEPSCDRKTVESHFEVLILYHTDIELAITNYVEKTMLPKGEPLWRQKSKSDYICFAVRNRRGDRQPRVGQHLTKDPASMKEDHDLSVFHSEFKILHIRFPF